MVYRYETNMKSIMSLSPRCAARSRRSRTLIILYDELVLVQSGMPDLGSCASDEKCYPTVTKDINKFQSITKVLLHNKTRMGR
jgi:hypothetical protein